MKELADFASDRENGGFMTPCKDRTVILGAPPEQLQQDILYSHNKGSDKGPNLFFLRLNTFS